MAQSEPDLSDDEIEAAKELAAEVQDDPDATAEARAYAAALADGRAGAEGRRLAGSESRGVVTQLRYLQGNVSDERAARIAELLGNDPHAGFKKGYCTVCGTRNDDRAAHPGTDADGLVCEGCYDDFGEPNECDACGAVTYEGDKLIGGPREGEWLCNSCLSRVPTGPPGEF